MYVKIALHIKSFCNPLSMLIIGMKLIAELGGFVAKKYIKKGVLDYETHPENEIFQHFYAHYCRND